MQSDSSRMLLAHALSPLLKRRVALIGMSTGPIKDRDAGPLLQIHSWIAWLCRIAWLWVRIRIRSGGGHRDHRHQGYRGEHRHRNHRHRRWLSGSNNRGNDRRRGLGQRRRRSVDWRHSDDDNGDDDWVRRLRWFCFRRGLDWRRGWRRQRRRRLWRGCGRWSCCRLLLRRLRWLRL